MIEPQFAKWRERPEIDHDAFREFVAAQNPDAKYDYGNACDCPVARYLKSIGEPCYARSGAVLDTELFAALNPPFGSGPDDEPTWGALFKRLVRAAQ
jgi:hypothetical protein